MIDLRENKIKELPVAIGKISTLSVCLLSKNHLTKIPQGSSISSSFYSFLSFFSFQQGWFQRSVNVVT